jgi:DNA-binding XRE family transcriptional regulator
VRDDKKKKLEARGWRVASAESFLELEPQELAYVEIRLRLSDGLKERRKRARMSQAELAKRVHSSQSRIAKMEAGDPTVSLDLLIRTLLALGASGRDVGGLIARQTTKSAA